MPTKGTICHGVPRFEAYCSQSFTEFKLIRCAYELLRCLHVDLEKWRLPTTTTQPITLPLAHARRVTTRAGLVGKQVRPSNNLLHLA
jgi:hypothetical protein